MMGRPLFKRLPVTRERVQLAAGGRLGPGQDEPMVELHSLDDIITDPDDPRAVAAREANRRAKAKLLQAGGRRVNVNLGPRAAGCLGVLQQRLGGTATDAIEHALIETAKRRRA